MIWLGRIAAVLLGVFVCILATVLHRVGFDAGAVFVPWGLILGVIPGFLLARALTAWGSVAEFFVAGWAFGLAVGFGIGASSQLILFDLLGIAFLVAGLGALFAALSGRFRL